MTYILYAVMMGIFFLGSFGKYVEHKKIDRVGILKLISIKIVLIILFFFVVEKYFNPYLQSYLIGIFSISIALFFIYLWKYFKGFNF